MSLIEVLISILLVCVIATFIVLFYVSIKKGFRIPPHELRTSLWLAVVAFIVAYFFGVLAGFLSAVPLEKRFADPLVPSAIAGLVILMVQVSGVHQAERLTKFIDIYKFRSLVRGQLIPFAEALINHTQRRLSDMQKEIYSIEYTELLTFYVSKVFGILKEGSSFKATHKKIEEWGELFYREYFESSKVALARGIKIERVFILRAEKKGQEDQKREEEYLAKVFDILEKQWDLSNQYAEKERYRLHVTRADLIPRHLDKNYAIINESVLMSESESETTYAIRTSEGDIKAFVRDFATLSKFTIYLTTVKSFFKDYNELTKALDSRQQKQSEVEYLNEPEIPPD